MGPLAFLHCGRPKSPAKNRPGGQNAARSALRYPVRAGQDRPRHRPQPLLPGAPLQRHGLRHAAGARGHARREGRGRLGRGLHRGMRDPSLRRCVAL